jgi:hypothetical protein
LNIKKNTTAVVASERGNLLPETDITTLDAVRREIAASAYSLLATTIFYFS